MIIHTAIRKLKSFILQLMTPKDPYVHEDYNQLHVYRCYDHKIETLAPVSLPPTCSLADTLIQSPGLVEVNGQVFDLRHDGVYRFYRLPKISVQRVVCSGGADSLLKMLGYLWIYGNRDDNLPGKFLEKSLKHKTISASCGALARQAYAICKSLGIESRVVASITKSAWGKQDEGHTLLEIQDADNNWVCYDPSFHYRFLYKGKYLTLLDLSHLKDEEIEYEKLPGNDGHGEYAIKGYDYSFWVAERLLSLDHLKTWYRKILDVPLILVGRNYYYPESFVDADEKKRFEFRYKSLTDQEFNLKFYPYQKDER